MAHDRISSFDMDNWTTQLRKGLLELCIVNLLSNGELYGYDLVKRLQQTHGLVITEGTIYPLLSRLKRAGLVETRLVESSSGPVRKYYGLSEDGKKAMALMRTYWLELIEGANSLMNVGEI